MAAAAGSNAFSRRLLAILTVVATVTASSAGIGARALAQGGGASAAPPGWLSLAEASAGAGVHTAVTAAVATPCGGVAAFDGNGTVSMLAGRAPRAVAVGDVAGLSVVGGVAGAAPLPAASRLVAVVAGHRAVSANAGPLRATGAAVDVALVAFDTACTEARVVATATVPASLTPAKSWRGIAVLPPSQIVLLGDASPAFVLLEAEIHANGTSAILEVISAGDVAAGGGWGAVAGGSLGNVNGGASSLLVASRNTAAPHVVAVDIANFSKPSMVASVTLPHLSVAPSTSILATHIGSLAGDGLQTAVVTAVVNDSQPTVFLLALNDSSTLSLQETLQLDANHSWVAATVAPVLGKSTLALRGELQLVAFRSPSAVSTNYPVSTLVYGRSEHYLARRYALDGTRSMYGFDESMNMSAPVNVSYLKAGLQETHANTYSFIVCDHEPRTSDNQGAYTDFVRTLAETTDFAVDGQALRLWMTLLPPTEAVGDACVVPADSPLTPWNDTALFGKAGYLDYAGWAALSGKLASMFPNFVALQIDDMSHDIQPPSGIFTSDLVSQMTNNLRATAPWMSLVPTTYYAEGSFVWDLWPDFPMVVDTCLFYFRNEKQGAGPCANPSCKWGPKMTSREGGCLAGPCADSTAANVVGEIADIAYGMPPGRPLQVGFYATGHSRLGTPTPRYVYLVMNAILAQNDVAGITFYRMHVPPPGGCANVTATDGCVAAEVFASLGVRRPTTSGSGRHQQLHSWAIAT